MKTNPQSTRNVSFDGAFMRTHDRVRVNRSRKALTRDCTTHILAELESTSASLCKAADFTIARAHLHELILVGRSLGQGAYVPFCSRRTYARHDSLIVSLSYQLLGLETAKASLLFSMEQAVIQGWVGLDPVEEASVVSRHKQTQQVGPRSPTGSAALCSRLIIFTRDMPRKVPVCATRVGRASRGSFSKSMQWRLRAEMWIDRILTGP